ncbi:hypothetical protein [Pseudochryseolinea flava]|uniref:Apea-like HEPN domain-containing protein n=1 Tax=Pseudochryseolinea flava TaxID=2059302 RepID=A0A364XUH8_9BACT|nr:hypothetical protein [Pseudochryseolinea flava]RAV97608.1 hypothetical protein DQQ10_27565 [Pseudochryseolinea flava]
MPKDQNNSLSENIDYGHQLKKFPLHGITGGQVQEILDDLKQQGIAYRCDFDILSKHFLFRTLNINPFLSDFSSLRKSFLEDSDHEQHEVPENENEFHKYVCRFYFTIVKSPKDELLGLYEHAFADIKAIDRTLAEITQKQSETIKRNDTAEIQELIPILKYYQQHNEDARTEIMNFLKDRIHNLALNQCYDSSLFPAFFQSVPYSYYWNSKAYTPHPPSDLDNKFGDLPVRLIRDLKVTYESDRPAFNRTIQQYISEKEIIFSISDLLHKHHILDQHSTIIREALDTYSNGSKMMFANAVPTIIEGIFHDICKTVGTPENVLLTEGFQQKLNRLRKVLGSDLEYEYYSFRFRLFRNKVAHGRMNIADQSEISDMLLLDLYHASELCFSNDLKLNKKRFLIDQLNKGLSNPDYKYLIEYLLLGEEVIPAFYHLESQIIEVERLISSDGFWAFLENELDQNSDPIRHGIHYIVTLIAKRKPFDKRCTKLLKKAKVGKPDYTLLDKYVKGLHHAY